MIPDTIETVIIFILTLAVCLTWVFEGDDDENS